VIEIPENTVTRAASDLKELSLPKGMEDYKQYLDQKTYKVYLANKNTAAGGAATL